MDIIHTKENLFNIVEIHNHASEITFKTESDSHKNFGLKIIVTKVFDEDNKIKENITNNKLSMGLISCLILKNDIQNPVKITFDTEDILELSGSYFLSYI
jgi:hypothetical protein